MITGCFFFNLTNYKSYLMNQNSEFNSTVVHATNLMLSIARQITTTPITKAFVLVKYANKFKNGSVQFTLIVETISLKHVFRV